MTTEEPLLEGSEINFIIACSSGQTSRIQPLRLSCLLQYKGLRHTFVRVPAGKEREYLPDPHTLPMLLTRERAPIVDAIELSKYLDGICPENPLWPKEKEQQDCVVAFEKELDYLFFLIGKRLIGNRDTLRTYLFILGTQQVGPTCCFTCCFTSCGCDCLFESMSAGLQQDLHRNIEARSGREMSEKIQQLGWAGAEVEMRAQMDHWNSVLLTAAAAASGADHTYLCGTPHPTAADMYLYVLMEGMVRGYHGIVGPLAGRDAPLMASWPCLKAWWVHMQHSLGGPASEGFKEDGWVWSATHAFCRSVTLRQSLARRE